MVDCLHGDLSQAERNKIMGEFKAGNIAVLVATDVAARGIDVSEVDAVFNYDVPDSNEYYTHRIGRTDVYKRQAGLFSASVWATSSWLLPRAQKRKN